MTLAPCEVDLHGLMLETMKVLNRYKLRKNRCTSVPIAVVPSGLNRYKLRKNRETVGFHKMRTYRGKTAKMLHEFVERFFLKTSCGNVWK